MTGAGGVEGASGRPPVSVLIPAYNAAATLRRALESVAAQDYAPVEIVVVDDGSADDTARIAEGFPRVTLVRHAANRGASAALNTAIDAATHDLIAFLDADDEWLPGKLDAQVAALAAAPDSTLVATAFVRVHTDGSEGETFGTVPFAHDGRGFWRTLLFDAAVKKSTAMTRLSLIRGLGGFDTRFGVAEDQDMWLRLAAAGPVAYVPRVLARYHATPGSLMSRYRRTDLNFVIPMLRKNLALLGGRLSARQRRAVLAHRYRVAASNMRSAGDTAGMARAAVLAVLNGGSLRRRSPGEAALRAMPRGTGM